MRGVSEILAALVLLMIAIALAPVIYIVTSSQAKEYSQATVSARIVYARLTYLTDSAYISGATYAQYRLEVTIDNPSNMFSGYILVLGGYGNSTVTFASLDINVKHGVHTYTFIVNVPASLITQYCAGHSAADCPLATGWVIALQHGDGVVSAKVPIYEIP